MNVFLKVLASSLLLISIVIFTFLFLILSNYPTVIDEGLVSSAELLQTRSFIEKSDPRNLQSGSVASLVIRDEDIQLLLNYILEVAKQDGAAEVNISDGLITTVSSVKTRGGHLNLRMTMSSNNGYLKIERLKLGALEFPRWLSNTVVNFAHQKLRKKIPEYAVIFDAVDSYKINQSEVTITYKWQPELIDVVSARGRDLLIEDDEKERLRLHALNLAKITSDTELPTTMSLVDLLKPMFEFARSRNGNPVEENRAAIMVMALYIMDINFTKILGDSADSIVLKRYKVTLSGRQDFAKHFITSAAIKLNASTNFADSVGIMKEIEDSSVGGSGFSFTDVGADMAGVRFAELAVSNSQYAVLLQEKLSGNVSEDAFIPDLKDLPEFMSEDKFFKEYGDVNQPKFQSVIKDIEERISRLPLFNL